MHINPEMAAAREISRALRFPSDLRLRSFAKSRVELVDIKIKEGNPLIGKPMFTLYYKRKRLNVLFCVVQRGDDVFIPTGQTVILEGDRVSLTGSPKDIRKFLSSIGIITQKVKDVMIVGGGRIAFYLTLSLLDMGMHIKIIEKNREKCLQLSEKFPDACIIEGDGTDHELLLSESLEEQDAFIALTDNDKENIIISMFAGSHGVKTTIPKVNRISLGFLLEKLGLNNIITPKNITADQIVQYVRARQNSLGSNVESLMRIYEGKIEILEFRVKGNCKFLQTALKDIRFKHGILIACITHKGMPKVANGDSVVNSGDTVIVISSIAGLGDINDVLA